jgi:hypothetical protein
MPNVIYQIRSSMGKIWNGTFRMLLGMFMVLALIPCLCLAADSLKYPGNGFSHFSKNKVIGDLNDEIQRQASSYPSIKFSQGKMIFKDISAFNFRSSRALIGPNYCLRVPLLIEKGSCRIEIDGVSYLVDRWGFRVLEHGKMVYESKDDKPVDIIVEVFSPSNSSTRFHFVNKPVEIVQVGFSDQANISIFLDENCSGTLGPWEWLRGYE